MVGGGRVVFGACKEGVAGCLRDFDIIAEAEQIWSFNDRPAERLFRLSVCESLFPSAPFRGRFRFPSRPIKIAPRSRQKWKKKNDIGDSHIRHIIIIYIYILTLRRLVPIYICTFLRRKRRHVIALDWPIHSEIIYPAPDLFYPPFALHAVAMKSISLDLIKYVDKIRERAATSCYYYYYYRHCFMI